jgi:hypothetical protein
MFGVVDISKNSRNEVGMRTSDVDACLLISRGGLTGGACNRGLVRGVMGTSASSSLKNDSIRGRSILGDVEGDMLIKISASRVES